MEFTTTTKNCAPNERLLCSASSTAATIRVTTQVMPKNKGAGRRRPLTRTVIEKRAAGAREDAFESLAEIDWRKLYPSTIRLEGREMDLDKFLCKPKWYSQSRTFQDDGLTYRWTDVKNSDLELNLEGISHILARCARVGVDDFRINISPGVLAPSVDMIVVTAVVMHKKRYRVWRALPAELRAACFRDLSIGDKVALSRTSRIWRRNVLATPELWSTVRYPSVCPKNLTQLRAVLRWSVSSPLSITLDADGDGVFDELHRHMHRVRSFTTTEQCDGPSSSQKFNMLFSEPLPRLQTMDLYGWGLPDLDPSLGLSGHFPSASYLRASRLPFPGISHPMPSLRELECRFTKSTDSQSLFELCPNLERLSLNGPEVATTAGLPQGPPPRNLKHLALRFDGLPDLLQYFEPWAGPRSLQAVELSGLSEAASVAALFVSSCAGPWTLRVTTSEHDRWLKMFFIANGAAVTTHFEAKIASGADRLVACVPYFSNLVLLHVPAFVLVALAQDGNVTLPAVKNIIIARPYDSGGIDDRSVEDLWDLADDPASLIRVPDLRTLSFGVGDEEFLESMMLFVTALRSTIDFASERLESIRFLEITKVDVEALEGYEEIEQDLRAIAQAISWKPPRRRRWSNFGYCDSDDNYL
ncbi:hypothetical protein AURDEDRAFT_123386 [Auricularia subglabra TFB-10046 SS5]|nr:hypothetical protein AURDEDRAFT_123386 [Auricularia subglabra TFB-10046 SS5]